MVQSTRTQLVCLGSHFLALLKVISPPSLNQDKVVTLFFLFFMGIRPGLGQIWQEI